MTPAGYLEAAHALLGNPAGPVLSDLYRPPDSDVALAQVYLLAAIAIELGVPVVPGTHDQQAAP